jgi:hypothetical protein
MGNDMKQSFMGIGSKAGAWEPADIIIMPGVGSQVDYHYNF